MAEWGLLALELWGDEHAAGGPGEGGPIRVNGGVVVFPESQTLTVIF